MQGETLKLKSVESLFQSTSGSSQRWTTLFQLKEYNVILAYTNTDLSYMPHFRSRRLSATHTFKTAFLCSTLIYILKYNGLREM